MKPFRRMCSPPIRHKNGSSNSTRCVFTSASIRNITNIFPSILLHATSQALAYFNSVTNLSYNLVIKAGDRVDAFMPQSPPPSPPLPQTDKKIIRMNSVYFPQLYHYIYLFGAVVCAKPDFGIVELTAQKVKTHTQIDIARLE